MINFNDIFFNEGSIWLQKIKDHKEPIWTTLHPLAEKAARELQGMYPAHEMKLMGNKPLPYLNKVMKNICTDLKLETLTWHNWHHMGTQMMNDLGYPNKILQVLRMWEIGSMKTYIRDRITTRFNQSTLTIHKQAITTLMYWLQWLKGSMVWLPKSTASKMRGRERI